MGAVFDDADLWLSTEQSLTGATGLKVAQRTKYDLEGDGVAPETTRAAAQDIVAELTERGVIRDLETPIEVVGEAVAAIDEPAADQRFLELAESAYPELIISFDRAGQVAYLTPSEQGSPEVEPVWYAQWHTTGSEGRAGLLQSTSLSLTDPDAPLVPHARPE